MARCDCAKAKRMVHGMNIETSMSFEEAQAANTDDYQNFLDANSHVEDWDELSKMWRVQEALKGERRRKPKEDRTRSSEDKSGKFIIEPFDDVHVGAEPEYLVKDIVPSRGLVLLVGEPGCGKSFLAADMGLHIAQGATWGEKEVLRGSVVYITGEGATGFRKRLTAYRQQHPPETTVPFFLIADAPNLGEANGDAHTLINRIQEQLPGEHIRLIVIDTLARMMAGGDENSSGDMSAFIDNCGLIEKAFECAVMAVHHVGKDASKGARGSSVLKAAADIEIIVEGLEGERTARVSKSKDGESGLSLTFNLDRVDLLGLDREASSCVVTPVSGWQRSTLEKTKKVSGVAKIVLQALQLAVDEAGQEPPTGSRIHRTKRVVRTPLWRAYADKLKISEADTAEANRKAFKRASEHLQSIGKVTVWDDWVCINE